MLTRFERQLQVPGSAEEGFAWHERPGALDRLIPPWERVSVLTRGNASREGSIVELSQRLGPLGMKWVARYHDYVAGKSFRDTQVSGPFSSSEHLHEFRPNGASNGVLTDRVEYRIPGGIFGRLLGSTFIMQKLENMHLSSQHNAGRPRGSREV